MKPVFYTLIILLLASCETLPPSPASSSKTNIKAYYFPIDNLFEGKVYVYTPLSDSLTSYFVYYKNNGGYLTGTFYNHQFKVEQITNETVVRNGTLMNRIQLCHYSESNPDICEAIVPNIEYDNVFPFEVTDSTGVFLYEVNWKDAVDTTLEYSVLRNKHFLGFTTYEYKDKEYDCVKLGIREETKVGSPTQGYQTFKAYTEELYAKNLGLVYYKKNIDNAKILEYALADTLSMETLEQMVIEQ